MFMGLGLKTEKKYRKFSGNSSILISNFNISKVSRILWLKNDNKSEIHFPESTLSQLPDKFCGIARHWCFALNYLIFFISLFITYQRLIKQISLLYINRLILCVYIFSCHRNQSIYC